MKYRIYAGIFVFNRTTGLEEHYYWFYSGFQISLFSSLLWPNRKKMKGKTHKITKINF